MGDSASSAAYHQRRQSVAQATGGTWRDAGRYGINRARTTRTSIALVWAAYVVTIACNAAFEVFALGGTTSAEVSGEVFAWFTPAGYVFSIWSLIYVALIAWLVSYTREAPLRAKRFTPVSVLFIGSCVLNVLWLALWHFELVGISFIVILAEWAVLAALYLNVRRSAKSGWGWVPISIYTAWVTVAALANMAILVTRALDGGIAFFNGLSVLALTAGVLALGYVMRKMYDDVAFPLVFLWALIGVGIHVAEASWLVSSLVFILVIAGAVLTFVPLGKLRSAVRG